MDLHNTYPSLADLRRRAQKRIPKFVWEYLDSGTGDEAAKHRNRTALDRVGFNPSILHGEFTPDLTTPFLGQTYPAPFGIAPIGMSGLMWPDAEGHLARAAAIAGLPYSLSTVATQSPEDLAPHIGPHAWVRSGLTNPPRLTPRLLAQVMLRPAWAWGMARRGMPHMRGLDKYTNAATDGKPPTEHVGYLLRTAPDWDYVKWLRDAWDGPFIVKGVMRAQDAPKLQAAGVDALWVSNHAGRQFDGAPAAITALPQIRAATTLPLIFDSGIEGGLDILRARALGADFVMLGRAFHFALAALGPRGIDHLIDILRKDMIANMGQLGAKTLGDLPPAFDVADGA